MKKLFLLPLLFLFSCLHTYNIEVIYINGDVENILLSEASNPHLDYDCLVDGSKTIRCGVRSFRIINEVK